MNNQEILITKTLAYKLLLLRIARLKLKIEIVNDFRLLRKLFRIQELRTRLNWLTHLKDNPISFILNRR